MKTKSLRLSDVEVQEVARLEKALRLPSESATLKRIFDDGVRANKLDAVVQMYVNDERTIGETAKELNMSVAQVVEVLTSRHVTIMDVPVDLVEHNLRQVARSLELPNAEKVLGHS